MRVSAVVVIGVLKVVLRVGIWERVVRGETCIGMGGRKAICYEALDGVYIKL